MNYVEPSADCGVIVGRFQVAELHAGHVELINSVRAKHQKLVIVLGVSPVPNTRNNPLDFEARRQMIQAEYPDTNVLLLEDEGDDAHWSRKLDALVDSACRTQSVLLYGSRDSFIGAYVGRYPTVELASSFDYSGTSIREGLGKIAKDSPEWRAGVIWASRNRYPTAYATVDIAIFNHDYSEILLGRKLYEPEWRLIGGFSDPSSISYEEDVKREAKEEAGVNHLTSIQYLYSQVVDDWRYRSERDCIKTSLFAAQTIDSPVAGDDINEVKWIPLGDLDPTGYFPIWRPHRKLVDRAVAFGRRKAIEALGGSKA